MSDRVESSKRTKQIGRGSLLVMGMCLVLITLVIVALYAQWLESLQFVHENPEYLFDGFTPVGNAVVMMVLSPFTWIFTGLGLSVGIRLFQKARGVRKC